jgi:hypothetical protein
LVNGEIEAGWGAATSTQDNPWFQIDLGSLHTIDKVKIHNRGDSAADNYLPLVIEFSEDGHAFTLGGRRKTPFTQDSPWVYRGSARARYVRVRTDGSGLIALSEIQVYGQP